MFFKNLFVHYFIFTALHFAEIFLSEQQIFKGKEEKKSWFEPSVDVKHICSVLINIFFKFLDVRKGSKEQNFFKWKMWKFTEPDWIWRSARFPNNLRWMIYMENQFPTVAFDIS